jgi:hypothetical protein
MMCNEDRGVQRPRTYTRTPEANEKQTFLIIKEITCLIVALRFAAREPAAARNFIRQVDGTTSQAIGRKLPLPKRSSHALFRLLLAKKCRDPSWFVTQSR